MRFVLFLLFLISMSFAEPTLPFLSWGQVNASYGDLENGIVSSCYFEQGINWFEYKDFSLNTFVGIKPLVASDINYYWNNRFGPLIGFKFQKFFNLFSLWGYTDFGVRYEYYKYYFNKHNDIYGINHFADLSLGGSWKNLDRKFIVGYSLNSWFSVNCAVGTIKESNVVCSGYLEQSVDFFKINKSFFDVFIANKFNYSDNNDFWNNKIGVVGGIKIVRPFEFFNGSWGQLAYGIREEFYNYTKVDRNDSQIVLFLEWGFGGDWSDLLKNRKKRG